MKSCFAVPTSSDDRRSRAVFRSSAAVSIVLSLLALNEFHQDRARELMHTDLFALEIGLDRPVRVTGTEVPPPREQSTGQAGPTYSKSSEQDEFSFGPHYTGEPGGY